MSSTEVTAIAVAVASLITAAMIGIAGVITAIGGAIAVIITSVRQHRSTQNLITKADEIHTLVNNSASIAANKIQELTNELNDVKQLMARNDLELAESRRKRK